MGNYNTRNCILQIAIIDRYNNCYYFFKYGNIEELTVRTSDTTNISRTSEGVHLMLLQNSIGILVHTNLEKFI